MNIAEMILAQGNDAAPAILSDGKVVTYAELRRLADQIAAMLLSRGHAKGERIGILSENNGLFVGAYLGIIRAGLVAVPLQNELTFEALGRVIQDAGIRELIVSSHQSHRICSWKLPTLILTENTLRSVLFSSPPRFPEIDAHKDLAALMFTSGSTGAPKGVMITHRNIECNSRDIIQYLDLTPSERAMVVLPFHYCFGLSILHTHLMAGGSVVLNNHFRLFPENVLEDLRDKKCTGLAGVPSTYQILLRKTRFRQLGFPDLRWFQQAGGKLPTPCIRELLDSFPHVRFFSMYGQTEATARLSYLPPERLNDKLGSIGQGLPSSRLEVLKSNGQPVTPGSNEIGQIVASGDNISPGYWNDPVETASFFKNGRLFTGDLARVDHDGFIFFFERERDMIKPGGNRVSAREVEDVIAELTEVVEVAVIGSPHELLGEAIVAYIVARSGSEISAEDVETHCRKRLPVFKIPHEINFLPTLPHNSAGKILKSKLRELAKVPQYQASPTTKVNSTVPSLLIQTT